MGWGTLLGKMCYQSQCWNESYMNDARCGWAQLWSWNFSLENFSRKIFSNSFVGGQRILSMSDSRVWRSEKKHCKSCTWCPLPIPKQNVRLFYLHKKVCLIRHIHSSTFFWSQVILSKPTIALIVKKIPAKIRIAFRATAFLSSCKANGQRMQKYGR